MAIVCGLSLLCGQLVSRARGTWPQYLGHISRATVGYLATSQFLTTLTLKFSTLVAQVIKYNLSTLRQVLYKCPYKKIIGRSIIVLWYRLNTSCWGRQTSLHNFVLSSYLMLQITITFGLTINLYT